MQETSGPGECVRIGIDFGNVTTKIVIQGTGSTNGLPCEFSSRSRFISGNGTDECVMVIPSIISYAVDGKPQIGEVCCQHEGDSAGPAIRWLKHYLSADSPVQVPAGNGRMISSQEAAGDFLFCLLTNIMAGCGSKAPRVTFTVPVIASPQYEQRIAGIAAKTGIQTFRLLDEVSALACGNSVPLSPDQPVLVIDFGGMMHTVTVACADEAAFTGGSTKHRVRVLGHAEGDTGGACIDHWISDAIRSRRPRYGMEKPPGQFPAAVTRECERAKEQLSTENAADISVTGSGTGTALDEQLTRDELNRILEEHAIRDLLNRTIDRALSAAHQRGIANDQIGMVILAGGGAAIPYIQDIVRQRFPGKAVLCSHPHRAAARGAAEYNPTTSKRDTICHDYAIRYWDPVSRASGYRMIVRAGTPYPSAGQVARIVISAAYDGQTLLGIPICESRNETGKPSGQNLELVADASGGLRCADTRAGAGTISQPEWVHERCPVFLTASPPIKKGEPRFEVTFFLDGTKQILITARDVVSGQLVRENDPIVRIT
jgi:molecular chaperone DnaK (HSP70)